MELHHALHRGAPLLLKGNPIDFATLFFVVFLLLTFKITFHLPGTMGSVSPSFFEIVNYTPPDAIFELTKTYNADPDARKANLGQGTY